MSDQTNASLTDARLPGTRRKALLPAAVLVILGALLAALGTGRILPGFHPFIPGPLIPPPPHAPDGPPYTGFHDPQRVTIRGYAGDAMEPFVTGDGKWLLFNNSNDPAVNTNLHYAARVDGLTFAYRGEITGVNTPALEGVPSMDRDGNLYFVSTRSYADTFSTIYRGRFRDGKVFQVALVPGVSLRRPGIVNFDAEISADGNTLYVVDGDFSGVPRPSAARIVIATRKGEGFRRDPGSAAILKNVNTNGLVYAPSVSADGLELFFTRVPGLTAGVPPTIYRAARKSQSSPFGPPQQVAAITGFTEGPTLGADGHALYYHKRENGRFVLYRVTR